VTGPSPDLNLETLLRFALALAAVLALIGFTGWVLRRLVASGLVTGTLLSVGPGRPQRLGIIEVRQLDVRRRLVLIRRDDVEHLLLLGATGEIVIETGIVAPASQPPVAPSARDTLPKDRLPKDHLP
jgi:flagellar protein FliO/FliZ